MKRCVHCRKEIQALREEAGYGQIQCIEIGHDPRCRDFRKEWAEEQRE
jgi:hypothetical protein